MAAAVCSDHCPQHLNAESCSIYIGQWLYSTFYMPNITDAVEYGVFASSLLLHNCILSNVNVMILS